MKRSYLIPLGFALAVLLAGCGRGTVSPNMQRLDPTAPAAAGLPATPGPDEPAPLTERPAFGLYSDSPSEATLEELSVGDLSPDQRYRAAVTDQGAWVARVDGAWLWQIQLPVRAVSQASQSSSEEKSAAGGETAKDTEETQNSQNAQTTQVSQTPVPVAVQWMQPSYLLIQDSRGNWWKADPDWTTVTQTTAPRTVQPSKQQSSQSAGQQQGQASSSQQQGSQTTGQKEEQTSSQQQGSESEE